LAGVKDKNRIDAVEKPVIHVMTSTASERRNKNV
jgi:hypothetical protein